MKRLKNWLRSWLEIEDLQTKAGFSDHLRFEDEFFERHRQRISDLERKVEQLEAQVSKAKRQPPKPAPVRARNWTEVKKALEGEASSYAV